MRSKAPLALMELMIMLVVFALEAALAVSVFVFADGLSASSAERDGAVMAVRSTAELVKANKGGAEETSYDENWCETEAESAVYRVAVQIAETDDPLLGSALVYAEKADGERIFAVTVSWQEGADG